MTNEKELTHIDLFSGIGGFTLAGEWAGFRTVVFCEKEEFCQKVLQKRFGAVIADSPVIGLHHEKDEQKLEEERGSKFYSGKSRNIPIIPEIRDFNGTKWRGATLLTGGFPCQPFSVAGQRRGKEDDRYLWPEMLRVISEAKPRWILAENVPGIFRMALDTVLADLEGEGYTTGTFIIPACGLNAPHKRNRVWIVANSIDDGMRRGSHGNSGGGKRTLQAKRPNSHAPDPDSKYSQEFIPRNKLRHERKEETSRRGIHETNWQEDWYEVATRFCRVDDGVPDRVHRLKALGNAIVPQIAYEILKRIAWIENERATD